MKHTITIFSLITIIFLIGCTGEIPEDPFANEDPGMIQVPAEASSEEGIKVTEKGVKYLVDPDKILGGGPPKDGIPSIDNPVYVKVSRADEWIEDNELVLAIIHKGHKRVYPLQILVWHEIVNDEVGGIPVSVTYCPLCFTNQVFERILNDQVVEFGTSGKLYNSNLVMYDRLTGSFWSQALGEAITGELTGQKLEIIPFDVITWGDWKKIHPETLVLTTETGHVRAYGVDPYGDYYTDSRIIFPVENEDDRMHPKEIILGFNENNTYKAFKQNDVESEIVINDNVSDRPILLVSSYSDNARAFDRMIGEQTLEFEFKDGKIIDINTQSEWSYDGMAISGELKGEQLTRLGFNPGFWFEWIAFHPDTEVFGDE